ncbi:hypothetical protein [Rhodococcus erythropolis]|uniref:hypothetical protein n=1 Tax=Rhodococcus erythropolis TaxID=1833 RepID=UPI0013966E51|nr:hypothetical protein [Rhodococcus erythropolis]
MSAFGAPGGEEFRGVEAAEESLRDAEDFGGVAHAVGGIVFVVELAGQFADGPLCRDGGLLSLEWTGPPARGCAGGRMGVELTSLNNKLHSLELPDSHSMSGSRLEEGAGA